MGERPAGWFVALEGGEGAGKSVQAAALARRLSDQGRTVVCTRDPGDTPLGERIREALLHAEAVDPVAETLLFFAARAQLTADVIRPAIERGEIVICDRFTDSTRAYQGHGRGVPHEIIEQLNTALGSMEPDLKILLDLPAEEGLSRANVAGPGDRIEQEDIKFHERVRQGYLAIASEDPPRWLIVDATLPVETVTERIYDRIHALLPKIGLA